MPEKTIAAFGNFTEPESENTRESLILRFHLDPLDLNELWKNSYLYAKCLSLFCGNLLAARVSDTGQLKAPIQDEICYVSRELLGNAVKYNYRPKFMIEIGMYLHEDELRIYVTNSINPYKIWDFQNIIKRIMAEDITELFLEQMDRYSSGESNKSGIGYLTMINDFGVNLSWKFEVVKPNAATVTVLARMPIVSV